MGQHQCPLCGAWLDAGEHCDCENEKGSTEADQSDVEPETH